ncbi:MAG: ribosome biogenesis GTPase Der [Rhodobacteraceae bacterium]|nr:ribosome biogenesis GTPase Der [Paracoccaceae bacterium]
MTFSLAIVGRPNVGKSTLFNRLVGRRLALVDDRPGVTRDLREGEARLADLRFTAIDTAGLEEATDDSLPARMRRLTERAVGMADICLFVIDGRAGVTAADRVFADILRRRAAHVVLAVNKAEGAAGEQGALEAWELGLGEPVRISAEHGEGMDDLYRALRPIADGLAARDGEAAPETDVEVTEGSGGQGERVPTPKRPLQIAVIGRPNAGKSTLVNAILGEERLLTGPEAGITRDAISVSTLWRGTPVRIFDTAGMRRKSRISDRLEKMSVADGLRAVRFAEVVVVLLDAAIPFETQDLRIADLAEAEGRAVVVAVNKWDAVPDRQARLAALKAAFERLLPQLRGAPLVAISGLTGQNLDRLHQAVLDAYAAWNIRVTTGRLNQWLAAMTAAHPPPAPGGRRIRLRYMTQVKTRPPAFVVMTTHADQIPEAYARYLVNGLRDAFGLQGTPIRLTFRDQGEKNPYRDRRPSGPSALAKHRAGGPPARRRGGDGGG